MGYVPHQGLYCKIRPLCDDFSRADRAVDLEAHNFHSVEGLFAHACTVYLQVDSAI